jgi:putative ABC transport system substrate-binding protein
MIRRREFIAGLGGAAAWPLAARAQQGNRVRRIGILLTGDENDPVWNARLSAFTQALTRLGWTDGRNVRMDLRWGRGDINRIRALAQELVGLQRNRSDRRGPRLSLRTRATLSPAASASDIGPQDAARHLTEAEKPQGYQ